MRPKFFGMLMAMRITDFTDFQDPVPTGFLHACDKNSPQHIPNSHSKTDSGSGTDLSAQA